tara:strand:+ start:10606 stop:10752 length:147 start_codon:yes stop_codon:yes gene_type:complete
MASKKTLKLQAEKEVNSKAHWFWISTTLNFDGSRWTKTKGLTYVKKKK